MTNRDERGQAMGVFLAVVLTALVLAVGLVVDGGRQVAAARTAEATAASAARAATDASSTARVGGCARGCAAATRAALAAGRRWVTAEPGVSGSVRAAGDGTVEVSVRVERETAYLRLLSLETVTASATARSELEVS